MYEYHHHSLEPCQANDPHEPDKAEAALIVASSGGYEERAFYEE